MVSNAFPFVALVLHLHFGAPAEHPYVSAEADVVHAEITYDDPPEYTFPAPGQWDLYDKRGNYWMGLDTWRFPIPAQRCDTR